MVVSIVMGVTQNCWLIMESLIKMDDDWGYPSFRKPHKWISMGISWRFKRDIFHLKFKAMIFMISMGNMTEYHGINLMRMQWGYNGISWNVILCKLPFLHPISIPGFWWGFVWRFHMMGVFWISFMGINVSSVIFHMGSSLVIFHRDKSNGNI